MKYLILLAAFIIFPVISSQAEDFSAAYKSEIQRLEGKNTENIATVNELCGSNIKMTQDWGSFNGQDFDHQDLSASCEAPLAALRDLCRRNDSFKSAITSKIKEFKCIYGPANKIELKDGIVSSTVSTKDLDPEYAEKYLEKML